LPKAALVAEIAPLRYLSVKRKCAAANSERLSSASVFGSVDKQLRSVKYVCYADAKLRIIDTGTVYTYAGLRQITATMPLTGLAVYDLLLAIYDTAANNIIDLL
jgi:hypothetical protein